MTAAQPLKWRRVGAGLYESEDGQHRIIRTRHEAVGPRGGTVWLWEHATPYGSNWEITGALPYYTLHEAKAAIR